MTRYPLAALTVALVLLIDPLPRAAGQVPERGPGWHVEVAEGPGIQRFPLSPDVLGSSGKEFTVEVRLREGALQRPGTLLRLLDGGHEPALQFEVSAPADGAGGEMLRVQVKTDFNAKALVVAVPVKLLPANAPHALVLRDTGFRIDLFADGVLVDQEWPTGRVAVKGTRAVEASSAIRDVSVWPAVLPDAAIARGNGGDAAIAGRERTMFGREGTTLQYWRPRGYNTSAGDAMPFFHDGVLHVFYLLDRRHHQSKWGLGAHQWGHQSTTDLIHWKTYPAALTIEHEWEASICTGSVFFENGRYFAFYATRMPDRSEHLGMATSDDGVHFAKVIPSPFDEPRPPYRRGPNRDPFVFGEQGDFHMLATASLLSPPSPDQAGALEELRSTDLKSWTVAPSPFLVTGYKADPECSDLFFWRGWYYLLFSENGQAHYRMSRSRSGPWTRPAVDVFDGTEARVMKTAAFTGDRRIGVAFVPDGNFGGHLVFRELLQRVDGTLRSTFAREMTPHGTVVPTTEQVWTPIQPGATLEHGGMLLDGRQGAAAAALRVPPNFVLRATLTPEAATGRFGLSFGSVKASGESGPGNATLEIDPARHQIGWVYPPSSSGTPVRLEEVQGLDRAINIELVGQGTIADLNVNGEHTLVHRMPAISDGSVTVFCDGGKLSISNLEIEALVESE